MIITKITNEWMSFKDLEQALAIPSPTLRRWSEKFPNFLGAKKINRVLSFPRESLEVFKLIKQLFDDGLDTAAVMATLTKEMAQTHDVAPIPKDDQAPTPDRQSPPALPEALAALIPLAERFVSALETIASALAAQGPQNASKASGQGLHHPDHETGQDGGDMKPARTREEIIAEVHRLRGLGWGAGRIRTAMVRAGWPSLAGPGHRLSKSTVARIIKGEIK